MTRTELKQLKVSCSKCGEREPVATMRSCHEHCFTFYCEACFHYDYASCGVVGVPAIQILAAEMC
jgi:hypothetical protein